MAGNIVCQLRAGSHKSAAVVLWAFLDLTDDPEVFVLCRKKKDSLQQRIERLYHLNIIGLLQETVCRSPV